MPFLGRVWDAAVAVAGASLAGAVHQLALAKGGSLPAIVATTAPALAAGYVVAALRAAKGTVSRERAPRETPTRGSPRAPFPDPSKPSSPGRLWESS